MSRRKSDDTFTLLWNLFMTTQWWVCPIMAVLAYCIFAFIFPHVLSTSEPLKVLGIMSRSVAPCAFTLILLIGLGANLWRWTSGLMLDRQTGSGTINTLTWREFEELVAAAYRRQGYGVVETGGGGADGGIDLVLHRNGDTYLVQCKHWRSSQAGVKLVRELHGITHSKEHAGSRGIFVTFGTYTQDARIFAQQNGIELVDRKTLLQMIESARQARSTQNTPSADEESSPSCPLCGKPMLIRTAKRGDRVGSKFWGCSGYPKCRGTQDC